MSVTFIGDVQHGQLHISQSLAAFEGRQILVTLIAPDVSLQPGEPASTKSTPGPRAAPEADILEDTGRLRAAPRASQTLPAQVVVAGQPPPRPTIEEE